MAFDMLIGSDGLRARLHEDLWRSRLSHAYIFEGAVGSGRKTLALALAAALACKAPSKADAPCCQCAACRKVLEGKSPDVIRITREPKKATIGVEEVRFLRSDVMMQPNDLDYKIYVIEEADLLTIQAQNALLLTLEEPPSYVLFLLLCTSATSLLETIRSRAPLLRLEPVRAEQMLSYLCKRDRTFAALPYEEQQQILLLADGSVGRALCLCDPKERTPLMERRSVAASYVKAVLGRRDYGAMVELMPLFGSKREEIIFLLFDIITALRDLVLLKRSDDITLRFYTDRQEATELCSHVSMQTLLSLIDSVETTRRQLLRNANVRLALTSLLS